MNRLLTLSALVMLLFATTAVYGGSYTVNSANDVNDGACNAAHCSLREAILAVNADGSGSISFAIGSGPVTISPATALPDISGAATLDATTQPGYAGSPIVKVREQFKLTGSGITVRGFELSHGQYGIWILPSQAASNITIERNFIGVDPAEFPSGGIEIDPGAFPLTNVRVGNGSPSGRNVLGASVTGIVITGGEVTVAGNYIHLADDGVTPLGSSNMVGMLVTSGTVTIGGSTAGARNVIDSGSSLALHAIDVTGGAVTIEGNYVGTNAAGSVGLIGASTTAIFVSNTTATSILRNVVAGNTGVSFNSTTGGVIRGNFIGTDPTGNAKPTGVAMRNGIVLSGTTGVIVGGTSPADRNIIDTFAGIRVRLSGASNTTVAGNFIGVSSSGTAFNSLGAQAGILVTGAGAGNVIGGSAAGAGNVIAGNASPTPGLGGGIDLETPDAVSILGNFIGTDPTGTAVLGNAAWGIQINSGSHVIGGTGPNDGNTIAGTTSTSASDGYGIAIFSNGGATIRGNRIGTNAAGTTALGNATGGILIDTTGGPITVGGSAAGARNVISGNGTEIDVRGDSTVNIQGNLIGTNAAGTADINNSSTGIAVNALATSTRFVLIGGTGAGEGNVISGFSAAAISSSSNGANLSIQGNHIGTDITGNAPIGNFRGVVLARSNATLLQNLIAYSSDRGVLVVSGTGNRINGNLIYQNGGLGIDLNNDGVTPNDPSDSDSGPNNLQNYPVLTSALVSGGFTAVSGSMVSSPNTSFLIELFSNPTGDPSGNGEGQTLIGTTTVTTNSGGNATFNLVLPTVGPGSAISATATNQTTNDTSEFSANVIAGSPGTFQFSSATYSVSEAGPSVTLTVTRTGGSVPASVDYTSANGTAVAGNDFTAAGGTLFFSATDTSKTITVLITNDSLDENDETFSVTLSNAGGATIAAPSTATVTITDDDAAPSLNISDANVTEGNSGTTTLTFNVSLSPASGRQVTVDYTTVDVTANAGSDYGARFGTLTFAPNETLKTITVTVNGDTMAEANETLRVLLSNPSNATISDAEGIGTINNDDGPPSISIADVTVIEGNSGTSTATLTVSLTNPSSSPVTVDWATNGNTASSGSDFTSGNGTVTFTPGQTSQTITVTINGDTSVEGNESFFVNLTNPANGSIADAQATVTIADDDGTPSLTISNVAVDESAGTAVVTVLLAPSSAQTVTVNASTSPGTATAGADYTTTNSVLTFAAGETTKTITIPIVDDLLSEGAETFSVTLDTPVNAAIANGTATVTIVDNDPTPQLTITDANVVEGNAGTTPATFTVSLSNASASTITVNWTTISGSASASSDFIAASGTLTFLPGETSKPVTVLVNGDSSDEPDETFFVQLNSPSNAALAKPQGTATIADDDGMPSLVIGDATVAEGDSGSHDLVFTVTLAGATAQTVAVGYATADGTATAGSDYAATSGTLTFFPGTTTQQVRVPVIGDTSVESDETLFVNLSGAVNATISDNQAIGTVANDDTAAAVPSISLSDATVAEGNAGTTNATFIVSLSGPTTNPVTVQYATANGSATAGSDYAAASGTVQFAPGVTSQIVTVAVAGDTSVEPDETFTVVLSNPMNATLADASGTGLIVNDDSPAVVPGIAINDATVTEGDSGTTAATFNVTLSAATTNTVTVAYTTVNGSAVAGSDYAAASGTLVFAPGVTSQTIAVAVAGDTSVEPDETFTVLLSNPANATLADGSGTGLIVNDDSPALVPGISINDATVTEGNSGTTAETFNVTLSAATTNAVTVAYTTVNGSAVAGTDYAAASGILVFAPGVTSQSITVAVAGDTTVEPDETFTVVLSNPANATLADGSGTGLIVNDDIAAVVPSITIHDAAVTEGNSGTTTAAFNVTLSGATSNTVTVDFTTVNGSALAGSDYAAASGTVVFAPGVTSRTISVAVAGDTSVEGNETFTVQLSNPANATLADAEAVGIINDDDTVTSLPSITILDANVNEGDDGTRNATFTVQLSSPSATAVTCSYATSDGSATAGSDYAFAQGTVTFAPSETSHTISIAIAGDRIVEGNESFFVTLSSPTNATLARARGTGTIVDDDLPAVEPAVHVSDVTVVEGDTGTRAATFVVTLSTATSIPVSVEYATADGTAVAGADYAAAHGSLFFPPGITSQVIEVAVLGDTEIEPDETFQLVLGTVTGATGGGSRATATIRDDDSGRTAAILPIAGSGPGAGGAFFRTTLQLHDPGEQAMTGNLVIRSIGGGQPRSAPYALQPHQTVDVSASFGSGFVTVDLAPLTGGLPEALARVFNDGAEHGTSGLSTTLPSVADAITTGRRGVLLAPGQGAVMRFNIGIRALNDGVDLTFTLRRASGDVVARVARTLTANVLTQESAATLFATTLQPNDSIDVSVRTGSAIVYGSAVDDISQDPSFVIARPLP